MIGKVFLTESKLHIWAGIALFVLAVAGAFGCFLAAICLPDRTGVSAAEAGFWILNLFSYVGPLVLFGVAIFQHRYGYYRLAGVRDNAVFLGSLLAVFVWAAAFILAEMLATTVLDAAFFLWNPALRNRITQRAFLLSLVAHGAPRLLFCLSVAFSVGVLYFTYDALSVLIRRTHGGVAVKIVYVLVGIAGCAVYQLFVAGMMYITAAWDAGMLLSPDSVLPLSYMLDRLYHDSVKDVHFMASALLHWVFYAGELLYIAAGVFLVKWLRRCDNEIRW